MRENLVAVMLLYELQPLLAIKASEVELEGEERKREKGMG